MTRLTLLPLLLALATQLPARPLLDSWYTDGAGRYARIYRSTADETAANAVTTWSRGAGEQSQPTYAGVHQIAVSDSFAYIRTSGLGFHTMGPWYLNQAKTNLFPNYPANQATLFKIPLQPTAISSSKTQTGLGTIGYFVDGIAMFDSRDAFSYSNSNATDATPNSNFRGDGVWNRDAYVNESVTFDAANAHQAGANHHYHANPPALRHLLGDSVSYDPATNRYTEQIGGNGQHSPIIGWVVDGLPIYGPYGYSNPLDPESGIRRMVTGYQKRDGSNGSVNLNATGRATLPQWLVRNDPSYSSTTLSPDRYGPNVNATYTLGHYLEDYAYKGDLGLTLGTDFDLNEYNVRYCVTPEFPEGTWAYFTCILEDGTPTFPYNIGRYYFAPVQGGAENTLPDDAQVIYRGGPEAAPQLESSDIDADTGMISLVWTGAEGGSYVVKESTDLKEWIQISNPIAVDSQQQAAASENVDYASADSLFHRIELASIAPFDDDGFELATPSNSNPGSGSSSSFQATSATTPPLPPQNVVTLAVNGIAVTITAYDQTGGTVDFTLDTSTLAPGNYSVTITFTPPNGSETTRTSTNAITIEASTANNILLLIVDDWGIDFSPFDNAAANVPLPNLPHMEKLAQRGIHFSNAYAHPLCSPTRASILTGRHPFRHGVGNPDGANLAASETALPELLASQDAPHGLASFGKWHLGGGRSGPADRGGWQKFAGILQGGVSDYNDWTKVEDGTQTTNVTTYTTTDQVNEAVEYIEARDSQPWFVWMAFNAPHTPFHDPAPYVTPENGYSTSGTTNTDLYIKALEALDSEIGRLLESVDLDKTNIILIGDNGTPNQVAQTPFGNGHAKADLYEGGIHVPMLAAGPDVTATAGNTEDTFVHCTDLFSTIVELAGIDLNAATANLQIDSQSLLPLFRGQAMDSRYIVSEKFGQATGNGRALRSETYPEYKLIIFGDKDSSADTPSFELYHLPTDANEQSPLNLSTLSGDALAAYNHLRDIDATLGGGYSD
ncbi:sulfatase-like hydrolase/transferase [Pelagicoccus sp. SDUM812005]|uniref:sulfatase-like hydrolase/transferase n=1 Tax=Pelagicoccus sp. SDUM812005 TaxID=3041257 RepID=UPI00280CB1BC|nr:sulfatase-like hydrolase/transferase [Pelagicoccus sp. SDUM812005]MDQ8181985.1 sulfatase-like hydrolase/transferase [Pelagicoccus sp. SDUM812005]